MTNAHAFCPKCVQHYDPSVSHTCKPDESVTPAYSDMMRQFAEAYGHFAQDDTA